MTGPGPADREYDELRAVVADMLASTVHAVEERVQLRPHQTPPPGDWLGWLLLAGRGAGKTQACSAYVIDHVNGPPCLPGNVPHWIGIIAPTLGDAATSCFAGPAGIHPQDQTAQLKQRPGGLLVEWPNGSQAKLFGTREPDDIERLRSGGNTCLVWCEEMAAWRYLQEAWDQMRFGLRVGKRPRWIGSTTPKPRALIKKLARGEYRSVVLTHATMYDNPFLPEHIREALEEAYAGTSIGAQELYGRLLEQDENALWNRDVIERTRVREAPADLTKIEVGVDPSGGQGEQGIVVVGAAQRLEIATPAQTAAVADGTFVPTAAVDAVAAKPRMMKHGFVLGDRTVRSTPEGWSRAAVRAAVEYEADRIVVETNFGGDMAVSTLVTAADHLGIPIPIKTVHASRGKAPRAQPVSALSVQGRWHMVSEFELLEDQMCTWTTDSSWSPDRIDGMVWPAWSMKLVSTILKSVGTFGGTQVVRRSLIRRRSP